MATFRLSCLARQDMQRTASFSERLRLTANLSSGMRRSVALCGALTVTAGARSQSKREIRAATAIGLTAGAALIRAGTLNGGVALRLRTCLSVDRTSRCVASASLSAAARLTTCLYRACAPLETIDGRAAACADISATFRAAVGLGLALSACKDLGGRLDAVEFLFMLTALGKREGRKLSLSTALGGAAAAVKDYSKAVTAASGLYLLAASGYLDRTSITIRCDIPPGGTLVIDTERYTVTLNGENILHLQEGDWPRISRDTLSLAVSSATGGALEGRAVYQEAYL